MAGLEIQRLLKYVCVVYRIRDEYYSIIRLFAMLYLAAVYKQLHLTNVLGYGNMINSLIALVLYGYRCRVRLSTIIEHFNN